MGYYIICLTDKSRTILHYILFYQIVISGLRLNQQNHPLDLKTIRHRGGGIG